MAYLAAAMIIIGVALFVAAPLAAGLFPARRRRGEDPERERLEHQRGLAVQGLRELEFDREMGKLSDADYENLHAGLELRALTAMAALEKLRNASRAASSSATARSSVRRIDSARSTNSSARPQTAQPRNFNFCPECGAGSIANAKFCGECGTPLRALDRATGRAD